MKKCFQKLILKARWWVLTYAAAGASGSTTGLQYTTRQSTTSPCSSHAPQSQASVPPPVHLLPVGCLPSLVSLQPEPWSVLWPVSRTLDSSPPRREPFKVSPRRSAPHEARETPQTTEGYTIHTTYDDPFEPTVERKSR